MRGNKLPLFLALLLPACAHVASEPRLSGFRLLVSHQKIRALEPPSFARAGEQYFGLDDGRKIRVRTSTVDSSARALTEVRRRLAVLRQFLELQSDPYSGLDQTASHCSIETAPPGKPLLASAHLRVSPALAIACHGRAELSEERQYFYCPETKKLFEISLFAGPEKPTRSSIAVCD